MAKTPKLPQTVYVSWSDDTSEQNRYLRISEDLDSTVDAPGEQRRVGVYELKELMEVKAAVTAKRVTTKRVPVKSTATPGGTR